MISPLPSIQETKRRLEIIFPEGIPDRNYYIRLLSARTIYVFLYTNAVEGSDVWLAPKHVTRMSEQQAKQTKENERLNYATQCIKPGYQPISNTWYGDNTRESIRDETINGLIDMGIVIVKEGVPTTSSKGRYALSKSFAQLFRNTHFDKDILAWQEKYMSDSYLSKIKLMSRLATKDEVKIHLPNGEVKKMKPGPSSILSKAVVEEFTKIHLKEPVVVWVSESGNKVITEDEELMNSINLPIDQKKLLPDIVLADLGRIDLLLIFVEVVATDGPFDEKRKEKVLQMCFDAGYSKEQVLFISVFSDRNSSSLKARLSAIAIDSLIWCVSEPEVLLWIGKDQEKPFVFD